MLDPKLMACNRLSPTSYVLLVVTSVVMGCTTRAEDVAIRSIAGTEEVAIEKFCITVSPDEKWLTFVEWRLTAAERVKIQMSDEYDARFVSLDLRTGSRTTHSIDSLSPNVLGLPSSQNRWKFHAGFTMVKEQFRPPGWIKGSFYFQRPGQNTGLALEPSRTDIRVVAPPGSTGTCSDCPPGASVEFRDRIWDLLSNDVSAVVQDGKVRAVYYWESRSNRVNAVLRVRDTGDKELVVDRRQSQGTMVAIAALRVSPDERYLAFVVHSKKQEFLAGPREELFIRDLQTGQEKLIASYGRMGNLIWSPAGQRLYFAGGGYASDSAVRVADVEAIFQR